MKLKVDIEKEMDGFHLSASFETESERFALLGASGSGKSMTLKCIAGIENPDRGRIVLGDRVLFDSEERICVPARERKVGYLFQNYALFPNMTVYDNVCCTAKERAYAESLIKKFGLSEMVKQYPSELSGGQAQRTAMARMLAVKPEVILLDEPFSALDNYIKTIMEHEILDILDEFKGSAVLVSHDRNEVYRLAKRIGVMDAGTLVDVQERNAFFDNPKTVAAARLTGCKNISRIKAGDDGLVHAVDWGIALSLSVGRELADAGSVGYRAHYFSLIDEADGLDKTTNVVDCVLQRVIEDTFSMVICFKQRGNESDDPDSLMTWIVDKNKWQEYKDKVMSGSFMLKIDPARLMMLKDYA